MSSVPHTDPPDAIPGVQYLPPSAHTVLPPHFYRRLHPDSIISTRTHRDPTQSSLIYPEAHQIPPRPFLAIHPSFIQLLGPTPTISVIHHPDPSLRQRREPWAHEAGVWVEQTGEVWVTSNRLIQAGRPESGDQRIDVYSVNVGTGVVTNRPDLPVVMGNGACPYGKYVLFCDQGDRHHPSQLIAVDPLDSPSAAKPLVLLNNYAGRPFNSLNDVIVLPPPASYTQHLSGDEERTASIPGHPPPGSTVWFTDPTYGYDQNFRDVPDLPPQVYAFDPYSGEVKVAADGFDHPNGLCFSPDGAVCYITDTGLPRVSTVYAFDVVWPADPREGLPLLTGRRVFAHCDTGWPDGIKCDERGNVYSGCGDGIHVWSEWSFSLCPGTETCL